MNKTIILIGLCMLALLLISGCIRHQQYNIDCLDEKAEAFCGEEGFNDGNADRFSSKPDKINRQVFSGDPFIFCSIKNNNCNSLRDKSCNEFSFDKVFLYLESELEECKQK